MEKIVGNQEVRTLQERNFTEKAIHFFHQLVMMWFFIFQVISQVYLQKKTGNGLFPGLYRKIYTTVKLQKSQLAFKWMTIPGYLKFLTCMKPCKSWDKLPTSTGEFNGFLVAINSMLGTTRK